MCQDVCDFFNDNEDRFYKRKENLNKNYDKLYGFDITICCNCGVEVISTCIECPMCGEIIQIDDKT